MHGTAAGVMTLPRSTDTPRSTDAQRALEDLLRRCDEDDNQHIEYAELQQVRLFSVCLGSSGGGYWCAVPAQPRPRRPNHPAGWYRSHRAHAATDAGGGGGGGRGGRGRGSSRRVGPAAAAAAAGGGAGGEGGAGVGAHAAGAGAGTVSLVGVRWPLTRWPVCSPVAVCRGGVCAQAPPPPQFVHSATLSAAAALPLTLTPPPSSRYQAAGQQGGGGGGAQQPQPSRYVPVSRPFPSWNRSILTEIYLCRACSCQEILRTETAGQGSHSYARVGRSQRIKCALPPSRVPD
eukprot:COSAG01_NODE_2204_length_8173_cov_4.803939_4_plen_290_part_00